MKLEICADSLDSVAAAAEGGAHRVELCSGLSEGGITPSYGLIKSALKYPVKVNVLIRPRGGDFIYTEEETACMEEDIRNAVALGANGVVIGALTPEGDIDVEICRRLVRAAGDAEITFHRAFDVCRCPTEALETIIKLGCNRLLTSGQAPTADKGIEMLAKLVKQSDGRIIIMPGSGVNPENAEQIIRQTGATEIHASARSRRVSGMTFRNTSVNMGTPGIDEYSRQVTDPEIMNGIISNLNLSK